MLPGERRTLRAMLLLAAVLRGAGLFWDGGTLQHPDERFLAFVAERVSLPRSLEEALDPQRTPADPARHGFDFFVYGALPPLAHGTFARLVGARSLSGIVLVARGLVVLLDLASLLLIAALARRLGGARAGWVAAALWATCGVAIQQSRFATVDVWGTAAVLGVAWATVGRTLTWRRLLAAGALAGVAGACRPNLAAAVLMPAAAVALGWLGPRVGRFRRGALALLRLALVGGAALVALKLLDPGLFASTFSLSPSPARFAALSQLRDIVAGRGQYPPNLQWADRRAVLDPLANLLLWGTGPLLGVAVLAGSGRALRRLLLGERRWLPLLAWALPQAAWQLTRFVCSVRHLHALLALGVVAAAVWLVRRRAGLRWATLVTTAVWGLGWAGVVWREHTRLEASRWMAANLPAGSVVTAEYWDDALPVAGFGEERFRVQWLRVFEPDTPAKREELLAALGAADAVVLASQRGVGSICRVPDAYPLTSEFYHLLFSGALGFDLAATFQRRLGVGFLSLSDLGAEEAVSVYDHPPVWIFRKTDRYQDQLARTLLGRVALPGATGWETRDLEARGTPPYRLVPPGANPLPGSFRSGTVRQVAGVVVWVILWELLGLGGRRVVQRLAPGLPDGGWGVARWAGGAVAGVAWLWLGWARVPGWNGFFPFLVAVAALPWGVRAWRAAWRDPRFRLAAWWHWGVLGAFLAVRAANPEIYWGEKPMDAAILCAIWRAEALPPGDPWFAGAPLNYYFFGFLPHALVGRAGHLGLGLVFNLAAATVPALTAGAALSLGWLLAGRAGAAVTPLVAQLLGTAAPLFRPGLLRHPGFSQFWAASRVIPNTINEFPVWTALFADLHAHFLAFPGFLAAVLALSAVALGYARGGRAAAAVGTALGLEWMTNSWELPALCLLLLAARGFGAGKREPWRSWLAHGGWLARVGGWALGVSLPCWLLLRQASSAVRWNREATLSLGGLLELFGPLLALLAVAAVAMLGAGEPSRTSRWAWVLAAVGCGLILAPGLVTVVDPMNTVFKLHLQAHLLLAVAVGGVLPPILAALRGAARVAAGAATAMPLAVGFATTLALTVATVRTERAAGPRPSLDGTAYLATTAPVQAACLEALARLPAARVVVEPAGPPYSDTLRVPMFTGHPAVVGWEYHLWQRRQAWSEIGLRQDDLAVLTWGAEPTVVAALARRYRVAGACAFEGALPAVARLPSWRRLGDTLGVSLAPEEGAVAP